MDPALKQFMRKQRQRVTRKLNPPPAKAQTPKDEITILASRFNGRTVRYYDVEIPKDLTREQI